MQAARSPDPCLHVDEFLDVNKLAGYMPPFCFYLVSLGQLRRNRGPMSWHAPQTSWLLLCLIMVNCCLLVFVCQRQAVAK